MQEEIKSVEQRLNNKYEGLTEEQIKELVLAELGKGSHSEIEALAEALAPKRPSWFQLARNWVNRLGLWCIANDDYIKAGRLQEVAKYPYCVRGQVNCLDQTCGCTDTLECRMRFLDAAARSFDCQ